MPEEIQNPQENPIQGWKDVMISLNMPLDVIVNFMNVLNQRLCAIENVVTVAGPEGKMISLTDLYAIQTAEAQKLAQQQQEQQNTPQFEEQTRVSPNGSIIGEGHIKEN